MRERMANVFKVFAEPFFVFFEPSRNRWRKRSPNFLAFLTEADRPRAELIPVGLGDSLLEHPNPSEIVEATKHVQNQRLNADRGVQARLFRGRRRNSDRDMGKHILDASSDDVEAARDPMQSEFPRPIGFDFPIAKSDHQPFELRTYCPSLRFDFSDLLFCIAHVRSRDRPRRQAL